jgi:SAM domain (Sterile alpha motif)
MATTLNVAISVDHRWTGNQARLHWRAAMDVAGWLRQLGLEQYEAVFREHDITEIVLASLTAEDLKELGVASIGHRRQLLQGIATLRADFYSASRREGAPSGAHRLDRFSSGSICR